MTKPKAPSLREVAAAHHVLCVDCPVWFENRRNDGSTVPAPMVNEDGSPVVKDGQQQFWRHRDGRIVTFGACRLKQPQVLHGPPGSGQMTNFVPNPRSDWSCEEPEKHAMIDRLERLAKRR